MATYTPGAYGLGGAEEALLSSGELAMNYLQPTASGPNSYQQNYAASMAGRPAANAGSRGIAQLFEQAQGQLDTARTDVGAMYDEAGNRIADTQGSIADLFGQGQSQLNTGINQVGDLYGQGVDQLTETGQRTGAIYDQAGNLISDTRGQVGNIVGQGIDQLSPYIQTGTQASDRQAALSGALGPEAQAAAMQAYQSSPYVDQARENAERAILRNAAVTGSVGSGNTLDQLFQNAAGMFMEDFGNQYNRMGTVADRGYGASTTAAGLRGQQAGIESALGQAAANIEGQRAGTETALGQSIANMRGQQANTQAGLQQALAQLSGQQAGVESNLGQYLAGLSAQEGGLAAQLGQAGANLSAEQAGIQGQLQAAAQNAGAARAAANAGSNRAAADLAAKLGMQMADYRFRTGENIAGSVGGTTSSLANLINQQGSGMADIAGNYGTNIANLYQQAGAGDAAAKEQLATLLSNLAVQSGSQYANQPIITPTVPDYTGQMSDIVGAIGGAYQGYQAGQGGSQ